MIDTIIEALMPALPKIGAAIPPLLGTLLGGLIAVVGQYVASSVNARSAQEAAAEANRRAIKAEDRSRTADLLSYVSQNAAPVIAQWRVVHEDGSNPELMDASEQARRQLHPVRERAMSIAAAMSADWAVDATDALFNAWDQYLHEVADRIAMDRDPSDREKKLVIESRDALNRFYRTCNYEGSC